MFMYSIYDLFLLEGHTCIFDPELHPPEVQQHLCVSLVDVLDWLVSGRVISYTDSSDDGLQTGQRKRDSPAGQYWLFVGDLLFCSFKKPLKFINYFLLTVHRPTVLLHMIFFDNIDTFP